MRNVAEQHAERKNGTTKLFEMCSLHTLSFFPLLSFSQVASHFDQRIQMSEEKEKEKEGKERKGSATVLHGPFLMPKVIVFSCFCF